MNGQLTSLDIARQLSGLGKRLDGLVNALESADLEAVQKRHTADLAESKAFVSSEGSMDMRRHLARIAVEREENNALVAEAVVRHIKACIRALDVRIDIGRSYSATVRLEAKMLPHSESP